MWGRGCGGDRLCPRGFVLTNLVPQVVALDSCPARGDAEIVDMIQRNAVTLRDYPQFAQAVLVVGVVEVLLH